jgi:folylpolyglutamate synthase/dihydropteroate synthase
MLADALNILLTASKPNKVISRDTVIFSQLMNILGHPHKSFKTIHVTGTNGKGSVTLKMASVL